MVWATTEQCDGAEYSPALLVLWELVCVKRIFLVCLRIHFVSPCCCFFFLWEYCITFSTSFFQYNPIIRKEKLQRDLEGGYAKKPRQENTTKPVGAEKSCWWDRDATPCPRGASSYRPLASSGSPLRARTPYRTALVPTATSPCHSRMSKGRQTCSSDHLPRGWLLLQRYTHAPSSGLCSWQWCHRPRGQQVRVRVSAWLDSWLLLLHSYFPLFWLFFLSLQVLYHTLSFFTPPEARGSQGKAVSRKNFFGKFWTQKNP